MTEPLDKMLAAVDVEILSSEDLMELDVFNQLVWELSPTLACPLINKRMKRWFERHYHPEIKQGLISRQAIDRMLTDCCYSVYSHIRSHGKNRCFTELEIHAYLDRTSAKQWGVEEEWGVLAKLVDYEAQIQLSAHISNKPSMPRKVRNA
jgi:secreted Zn-dependent insulinase-like peptidase